MKKIVLFCIFVHCFSQLLSSDNRRKASQDIKNEKLDSLICVARGVITCCVFGFCLTPQKYVAPKPSSVLKSQPVGIVKENEDKAIKKNQL